MYVLSPPLKPVNQPGRLDRVSPALPDPSPGLLRVWTDPSQLARPRSESRSESAGSILTLPARSESSGAIRVRMDGSESMSASDSASSSSRTFQP